MKFRTKLTICMVLLTSVLYGFGGALLIALTFRDSVETEKKQAFHNYRLLQSTLLLINGIQEQNKEQDVVDVLQQMAKRDTDWTALRLHTEEEKLFQSVEFSFDETLSESCSDTVCATKLFVSEQKHYRQITGCVSAGETKLYLDAVVLQETMYVTRQAQIKIFRILFTAVVLLSAIFSFLTAHFITAPLRRLSRTSKRIAEGDYKLRSNLKSGDEMEQLSENFNRMAEALTTKITELEEAMEQQERFMGSFAHELKTPMTSIIGYADLLRSCELPPEEQKECAGYIFREARRLERLSLKLLDLLVLKKQDFTLTKTSPARLVEETAVLLNEKLRENSVILTVQTEEGKCLLEPDLIKSLLTNLIDNSIKSMEQGGKIRVRQRMTEDGCHIVIRDNGRGMPEKELEKITEAFYRVDKSRSRRQGGAGLGLALCLEIVKLHNGTMQFFSEEGKGTEVVVILKGGTKCD